MSWYLDDNILVVDSMHGSETRIEIGNNWKNIAVILNSDNSDFDKDVMIKEYLLSLKIDNDDFKITSNSIIIDISNILESELDTLNGDDSLLIESLVRENSRKIAVIITNVLDFVINSSKRKWGDHEFSVVISEVNLSMKIASAILTMVQSDLKRNITDIENTNVVYAMHIGMFITDCLARYEYIETYRNNIGLTQVIIKEKFWNSEYSKDIISMLPSMTKYDSYSRDNGFYIHGNLSMIQPFENNTLLAESMIISDTKVDVLNKLQNVGFTINKKFLNDVINNYDSYLTRFKKGEAIFEKYPNHDEYIVFILGNNYNKKSSNYEKVSSRWFNSRAKSINFKNIVLCSIMYSDKEFYFRVVIDHRGRVYYLGYPLSPQMGDFVRMMINIKGEKVYGYDVTASGLQIIGGITGDENILRDTFLIEGSQNDIYNKVYEELMKYDNDLISRYKNSISRKFVKYIVMPLVYSQGWWGRTIKLINNPDFEEVIFDDARLLGDLVVDCFNNLYPSFEEFTNIINNINERCLYKWYTICSTSDYHMFYNIYVKQESMKVKLKVNNKNITRNVKIDMYEGVNNEVVVDKKSCDRSFKANFIQHIDSNIITLTSEKLFDLGINHFIVHDCIYAASKHYEKVNECYKLAFIDIMDRDILSYYKSVNTGELSVMNEKWLLVKDTSVFRNDILQLDENEFEIDE